MGDGQDGDESIPLKAAGAAIDGGQASQGGEHDGESASDHRVLRQRDARRTASIGGPGS